MAEEKQDVETKQEGKKAQPCRHLRSKGIIMAGGLAHVNLDEPDSVGHFWCNRTQQVVGPDDQFVGPKECCNPQRSCYENWETG